MKTPWSEVEWQRVMVYGLGVSGRAAVRFLRQRGVSVLAVDDRVDAGDEVAGWADDPGIELSTAGLGELPVDVDGVVVSPGVPIDRPLLVSARQRGVPVIGEVELAFPYADGTVVGITGSNGKSTTTALAGSILRGAGREAVVCGNFGRPLSDCVDAGAEVFLTELSSFQLESMDTFRPHAAALLNLSPDHLDRHGDLGAYIDAKAVLFSNQNSDDVAVFNADDPLVLEVAARGWRARRRYFSRRTAVADGCYLEDDLVIEVAPGAGKQTLFARDDLAVPGAHNLENAMAAALLARALGVESEQLAPGLAAFCGLPHRVERVLESSGVVWYDDSKGTNIAATLKSLEGFGDGTVHLILGGRSKGGDLGELREMAARKVCCAYLIGEAARLFEHELRGVVPTESVGDLQQAVATAAARATSGEVVLLSPACASFDQYDNFRRRGEHFQQLVQETMGASDG